MDITDATFQIEVLDASRDLPVVVDFWAPWCGPCRALGPILEKLAGEYAGRVKVVKVNSDENPGAASAYAVRSIPYVLAFKDGLPAAQFLGALPEGQVRAFFEKLLPSPSEQALLRAEAHFSQGDMEKAESELAAVKYDPEWEPRAEAIRQGIAFSRAAGKGPGEAELKAKLAADPADHESRLALAALCAGKRRYREAMDELLEIVRRAKDWRDGEARKQLLAIFNLAADQPDLVSEYRRKLAAALY